MIRRIVVAAAITLSLSLLFLPLTAPSAAADARPAIADTPDGAAAADLLRQVMRRYVEAPALRDTLTLNVIGQQATSSVAFDEHGNASVEMPGIDVTILDDRMYVVMGDVDDRYLDVPIETDLPTAWAHNFGPRSHPPFHFGLRSGRLDMGVFLSSLSMGFVRQPQLTGVRNARGDDDELLLELLISGLNGEIIVEIDAKTMLMQKIRLLAEAPPGMDAPLINVKVKMNPVVSDTLERPITFDTAGRTAVSTPRELMAGHPGGSNR